MPFALEEELRALSDLSEPTQPCSPVREASTVATLMWWLGCPGQGQQLDSMVLVAPPSSGYPMIF